MNVKHLLILAIVLCIADASDVVGQSIDWSRAQRDATAAELNAARQDGRLGQRSTSTIHAARDEYYVAVLKHRRAVFAWQAFAAKVIFWIVVVLVVSGLILSIVQFYFGLRHKTYDIPQELELSFQSIKLRTQFLGVVTLAVSLAFFYLYLVRVYPIVQLGTSEVVAEAR
jgi:hypothetical protein